MTNQEREALQEFRNLLNQLNDTNKAKAEAECAKLMLKYSRTEQRTTV